MNLTLFLVGLTIAVSALEALVIRHADDQRGRRWGTNTALMVFGSVLGSLLLGTLALTLPTMLRGLGVGVFAIWQLPAPVLWVVGFLLVDVLEYAWHRLSHQVPWLWRLHAVHHADPHVDASTTFRAHPLHALATTAYLLLVLVTLGLPPEVVLLRTAIGGVLGILQHTDLAWLPAKWDRAAAWLICTPRLHRLHHSRDARYFGSNYGGLLSFWDRMFGTLKLPAVGAPAQSDFGLGTMPPERAARLWPTLLQPFTRQSSPLEAAETKKGG